MPLKELLVGIVDGMSLAAEAIGAVNTVTRGGDGKEKKKKWISREE